MKNTTTTTTTAILDLAIEQAEGHVRTLARLKRELESNPAKHSGPMLSRNEQAVVRVLARGKFIAGPTLAGVLGLSRTYVHRIMWSLRQKGYAIESRTVSRGYTYRKIYRLDRAA